MRVLGCLGVRVLGYWAVRVIGYGERPLLYSWN